MLTTTHFDMPKRILSISYDESLLATRQIMLEQAGYAVTSALGFTQAISCCKSAPCDLLVLGHSIPKFHKQELITSFRRNCQAPVLSLTRIGEVGPESDYYADPDQPRELLATVDAILRKSDSLGLSGPSHVE